MPETNPDNPLEPLDEKQFPEVFSALKEACRKASFPTPKLYMNNKKGPTGVSYIFGDTPDEGIYVHNAIPVLLTAEEVQAVLLHEIGHRVTKQSAGDTVALQTEVIVGGIGACMLPLVLDKISDCIDRKMPLTSRRAFLRDGVITAAGIFSLTKLSETSYDVVDALALKYNQEHADSLAVKCGMGKALLSALDKIKKYDMSYLESGEYTRSGFKKYAEDLRQRNLKASLSGNDIKR